MKSSGGAEPNVSVEEDASLLTIEDVRSRLNVSISTVRRLVRDEKLPAYRVGGQLRFKPSEVMAYVDGQRVGRPGRRSFH
jgi:excisionase family DNA binding protein